MSDQTLERSTDGTPPAGASPAGKPAGAGLASTVTAGAGLQAAGSAGAGPTPPARMSRRRLALAAVVLAGALAAVGYGHSYWTSGRFIESTDDAYVGGDVTVMASKVAGFIAIVAVADNQAVHAGDVLIRIDDRDCRAALAKADAGVAAQRAALANIAAERRLQLALVAQAQADLLATGAEAERSRLDVERYRTLSHDQWVSLQRFQQADADIKKALAADERGRAALAAARRQIDVIDTRGLQAEAALQAAVADQDMARLNLGYAVLRAPIDGTVGNRSAQVGAFATVGAQLLSLVPAQGLWVDANFKESQLARLQPGLAVSIGADVLPGEVFHGRVASMAPATGAQFSVLPAENATGNFTKIVQRVPVRVTLDEDASRLGRLRPGLSVTAAIDVRPEAAPAWVAPAQPALARTTPAPPPAP